MTGVSVNVIYAGFEQSTKSNLCIVNFSVQAMQKLEVMIRPWQKAQWHYQKQREFCIWISAIHEADFQPQNRQ